MAITQLREEARNFLAVYGGVKTAVGKSHWRFLSRDDILEALRRADSIRETKCAPDTIIYGIAGFPPITVFFPNTYVGP